MSYDMMRHLADSWGLVLMAAMFVLFVGWTFRKGAAARMDSAARSIFTTDLPGDDSNGR